MHICSSSTSYRERIVPYTLFTAMAKCPPVVVGTEANCTRVKWCQSGMPTSAAGHRGGSTRASNLQSLSSPVIVCTLYWRRRPCRMRADGWERIGSRGNRNIQRQPREGTSGDSKLPESRDRLGERVHKDYSAMSILAFEDRLVN